MQEVRFTFTDPVEACLRLLLMGPLGADERNLAFFPEAGDLSDYCNGARMKRVHNALPPGAAALTCTLFFDEILRDQKGFNTGDGGIVVGGFFRAQVRESTHAKVSFCTFPKISFPVANRYLGRVTTFRQRLRHFQLQSIYECFTRFYRRGGAVVRLQVVTAMYILKCIWDIHFCYAHLITAFAMYITSFHCPCHKRRRVGGCTSRGPSF